MKIILKIIVFTSLLLLINGVKLSASEKIKIGLLVPLSGKDQEIGKSIVQAVRLAVNKINNPIIEIYPKDTKSNPDTTLEATKELKLKGIKIFIGPIFNENLIHLNKIDDVIFLSLTNKVIKNPTNVISVGVNAESQLNSIKKFQEIKKLKKTIFLIPKLTYENEIRKAISKTQIKLKKVYYYDSDPTKLTKQIELITKYKERKADLKREIKKIEKSDHPNKEKLIEELEKKDTLGFVNFDSVIIADFDESLKSITTSLLYADVNPKKVYFITFNQWFDQSLLKEKSSQPLYFPSVDKENFEKFSKNYYSKFNEDPIELSIITYDLVGLIYYLAKQNRFVVNNKIFIKKNKFKGKTGTFEINENQINYILNFYKSEDNSFKKIF